MTSLFPVKMAWYDLMEQKTQSFYRHSKRNILQLFLTTNEHKSNSIKFCVYILQELLLMRFTPIFNSLRQNLHFVENFFEVKKECFFSVICEHFFYSDMG